MRSFKSLMARLSTTVLNMYYDPNNNELRPEYVFLRAPREERLSTRNSVSQHRMRPEISSIIRHLTYPDLRDAPQTKGHPDLRGVQDNVIFINHNHPEDKLLNVADMWDMGSKSSKQNLYEVKMTLKIVRYLAQGYGTDKMVVLTPYLGQRQPWCNPFLLERSSTSFHSIPEFR